MTISILFMPLMVIFLFREQSSAVIPMWYIMFSKGEVTNKFFFFIPLSFSKKLVFLLRF